MSTPTLLQDTIDYNAPAGTGDTAVLHHALKFFLRTQLGATQLPPAPNLSEQRKMLPLLEGFAKAMIICAAGDGELSSAELEWIVGFTANSGGTYELLQELGTLDPKALDPMQLLAQTERPGLFVHSLVYNAICAADADGVLDPAEEQTIRAMAMVLGVPEPEVDAVFAVYRDEQALRRRKLAVLFPNGHPWG